VCSTFFLVDIVACFVTSPRRRRYATSLMTIVNFLSLIPTAVTLIVEQIDPQRCLYRFRVSSPPLALFDCLAERGITFIPDVKINKSPGYCRETARRFMSVEMLADVWLTQQIAST